MSRRFLIHTISLMGVLLALACGGGSSKTASAPAPVPTPVTVTGVALNQAMLSLAVGGTGNLAATVAPAEATDKSVAWRTSDGTVATVDSSGLVGGVKAGTATITVTTHDGAKTSTCLVTVTGSVANTVGTPTFSLPSGGYASAQSVVISTATAGATIHYTTNGQAPTANAAVYAGAIAITQTTLLQAIAVKAGWTDSPVASATYTIGGNAGWTSVQPSADSRMIYVSASGGSDGNDGLHENTPLKSLVAAKAKLRDGYPDWLLLKKGDTWNEGIGQWLWSGRSAAEPMVVSSYGSGARPVMITNGGQDGIYAFGGGPSHNQVMSHVCFIGLDLYRSERDPDSLAFNASPGDTQAVNWLEGSVNLLFEDCRFRFAQVTFQRDAAAAYPLKNVRLRRCHFLDTYGDHAQGTYIQGVDDLLIEGCITDHTGWNTSPKVHDGQPSMFNQSLYIQETRATGAIVRDNIVLRPACGGIQLRPGGVVEDNLVVRAPIAILCAFGGTVLNNVVLQGTDLSPDSEGHRGWGIDVNFDDPTSTSVLCSRNVVAHLDGSNDNSHSIMSLSARVTYDHNIVYQWGVQPAFETPGPFLDGNRSVASYNQLQGGPGTLDAFISEVRAQSKDHWQDAYTAHAVNTYIRAGFGM
ncbi:chitobiase/beta-hexosaminidase C-terminal domain-containing protein [Geothrix sp. PMB-07]|uniref:Ig-like domain-containing protein n=1 Tax=Geothrix sp. PMB-07 TaxID=3068640 RepID=UPI0027420713|nr:chitobiase/beta-hexosaminidase C-terminal domain-containing protein [Geothrix sp. PMB-07]WLT30367.1 chitobiase/beta-hexosaminidase C-terminal domain-containing protein [Geothrix sp. PMB-07]